MTEAQLRRAAELLKMRDTLVEWWDDTIAKDTRAEKYPYVAFSDIGVRASDGEGSGWDGDLILTRDVAGEMFQHAKEIIHAELTALGVTKEAPATPAPADGP